MKKTFPILLVLAVICSGCNKSLQNTSISETAYVTQYEIEIDLNCVENLLFSKYDLDIFVDDTNIGKLDHGTNRSYTLELEEGVHTLTATKKGNKNIDGTVDFTVSGDDKIQYKLSCTSSQVKIEQLYQKSESDTEKDTARNISGFDSTTNQTITFCGLTFSFPAYYDVRDSGSSDNVYVHYYPSEKDYYSSLIFTAEDIDISQTDFDSKKNIIAENIVKQTDDTTGEICSESMTIADLSGWLISYEETNATSPSTANISFVFNPNNHKIIYIMQSYTHIDQSNYDYTGDYTKIIQSASLSVEDMPVIPGTNSIDSIYDLAYVRELTEYSLYYLIDIDDKIVRYFSTSDTGVWLGSYSGDFTSGLNIYYDYDGGISETLKYKRSGDDSIVVLIDSNGFDFEYKKVDIATAEAILNQPGYHDMEPNGGQSTAVDAEPTEKKDDLKESVAKKAFEYYGEYMYPYGFECHWFTKLYEHTQLNDGSWKFKVGVTVTNQYGASVEAIAEALINNTTESVEDFMVYKE